MYYAQLNDDNICIGVSELSGEANDSKLVRIKGFDESYLWRKYENGTWSEKKFIPGTVVLQKNEVEMLMATISRQEAIIRALNEERLSRLEDTLDLLLLLQAGLITADEIYPDILSGLVERGIIAAKDIKDEKNRPSPEIGQEKD